MRPPRFRIRTLVFAVAGAAISLAVMPFDQLSPWWIGWLGVCEVTAIAASCEYGVRMVEGMTPYERQEMLTLITSRWVKVWVAVLVSVSLAVLAGGIVYAKHFATKGQ